jgi:hypothetical protein
MSQGLVDVGQVSVIEHGEAHTISMNDESPPPLWCGLGVQWF